MIAKKNAIVASHRMSPASVPSLAENVESTLVNMISLVPSCHSAANAAAPIRLRLGAEALTRVSLRIKDMKKGFFTMPDECPKNDTLRTEQICIGAGLLPALTDRAGVEPWGTYWNGAFHASNSRCHDRPAPVLGRRHRRGRGFDPACGDRRLPAGQRSSLRRPNRSRRARRSSDSRPDRRCILRSNRGSCCRFALCPDLHGERFPGPRRGRVDPTLQGGDRAIRTPRAASSASRLRLRKEPPSIDRHCQDERADCPNSLEGDW